MWRVLALALALGDGGCAFRIVGLEPEGEDGGAGPVDASGGAADVAMGGGDGGGGDIAPPVIDLVAAAPDLTVLNPDVAEDVVATWEVGESADDNIVPCRPMVGMKVSLAAEKGMKKVGAQAVRVDYGPDGANYFQAAYPKGGNAGWNLTGRTGLAFSIASGLPVSYAGWDYPGPTVVLCGANGSYRTLAPSVDKLTKTLGNYVDQMAPLAGGNGWVMNDTGQFSLATVNSIELHVDPNRSLGKGNCVMYLDDVHFY